MDNVSVRVNRGASAEQNTRSPQVRPSHGPRKNKTVKIIVTIIASILVISLLVVGALSLYKASTNTSIETDKYQAVFFTNGQVYFGKLQVLNGSYMKLNDVFYLQAKTTAVDPANPQATAADSTGDVELIKLGSEIHGPEDEMVISKDQILFFENLKKDGKVTQSIAGYQTKQ